MSEAKHTPGPWKVERVDYPSHEDVSFEITAPATGVPFILICQTIMREIATEKEFIARDQANARLIAAAPELLEVLEKISERDPCNNINGVTGECMFNPPCIGCVAREVIAKTEKA